MDTTFTVYKEQGGGLDEAMFVQVANDRKSQEDLHSGMALLVPLGLGIDFDIGWRMGQLARLLPGRDPRWYLSEAYLTLGRF